MEGWCDILPDFPSLHYMLWQSKTVPIISCSVERLSRSKEAETEQVPLRRFSLLSVPHRQNDKDPYQLRVE